MEIDIRVSKASDGVKDYIQVMSKDMLSVNIVLVVDKINIEDNR